MIIEREDQVTEAVLHETARIEDARTQELIRALIRHLHAFARKHPTLAVVGLLQPDAGLLPLAHWQSVAVARWLSIEPGILILDEPTQGVDVGAKAEIHALIQELAGRGIAIVMISSELPEVLAMSDRVAVMHAGTLSGVLSRDEATQDGILALALERSSEGSR